MQKEKTFIAKLKEAYEKAQKPLAYIVIFSLLVLDALSRLSVIPPNMKKGIELGLIVAFVIIIMETLFRIYERVVSDQGQLKIIKVNNVYDEILSLVKTGKNVKIQCIGVAGRFGWYSVISRLLDRSNDDSLHEANKFNVEIALISNQLLDSDKYLSERFDTVGPIVKEIERSREGLLNEYSDGHKKISLYRYNHFPNFLGFLINDNYLFFNACYWEEQEDGTFKLRASGTEFLIYDKNDDYGGSRYIERFSGWFNYIKMKNQTIE